MLMAASLMVISCGGSQVSSSTWLIREADDTVTVGDLGNAWNSMSDRQQQVFLSKENAVGEFIVTYGRRNLLEKELERVGYLSNPKFQQMGDSWLSEKCGELLRRQIFNRQMSEVPDDQVDHIMSFLGESAYFTIDPGEETEVSYGPISMPALPVEMIDMIDTLSTGASGVTETGIYMRLDSTVMADSAEMVEIMEDSANVRSNVVSTIANSAYEIEMQELDSILVSDAVIDSEAVRELATFYSDSLIMPDTGTVLMSTSIGNWSTGDLMRELIYYMSKYSVDPGSTDILGMVLKLLHYNKYSMNTLAQDYPQVLDSLQNEKESYILDIASEQFYSDSIQSRVTVTEEDMRELFESMDDPPTIPEKRVFQAVHMPRDSISGFKDMSFQDQLEFMRGREGFGDLAADSAHPQITRPLNVSEVPGFNGEDAFLMDPTDTTTWLGPLPLYDSGEICMFRLLDVLPERTATFEEARDQMRRMTRSRLEEQRTVEIMRKLEEKYNMVINEDILDQLPADIGSWTEL
jgi:hypothetical protein